MPLKPLPDLTRAIRAPSVIPLTKHSPLLHPPPHLTQIPSLSLRPVGEVFPDVSGQFSGNFFATHCQAGLSVRGLLQDQNKGRSKKRRKAFCGRIHLIVMLDTKRATMAIEAYHNQAEQLLKEYLLADPFVPYTSVVGGVLACKMVHDLTQLLSALYFKSYLSLSYTKRVEWNNRAMSTVHAIFITAVSLYFVFWADFFTDYGRPGLITFRSSSLSTLALGVSVGYFITDLAMIFWFYPSLGGLEYIIHHSVSLSAVAYAMLTGEGQLYTFMVLISETTTPGINLRWYLDTAGMKRSRAYLINGVIIFLSWLVARILLFVYMFYHVYLHLDQVMKMHNFGKLLVFGVPVVLSVMNLMWFGKIIKGLRKTLAKRQ